MAHSRVFLSLPLSGRLSILENVSAGTSQKVRIVRLISSRDIFQSDNFGFSCSMKTKRGADDVSRADAGSKFVSMNDFRRIVGVITMPQLINLGLLRRIVDE